MDMIEEIKKDMEPSWMEGNDIANQKFWDKDFANVDVRELLSVIEESK